MSNFEQTATAKERMRGTGKEAILSASYAKTDEDRQGLLELARTWTQAALLERALSGHHDSPAEASAA